MTAWIGPATVWLAAWGWLARRGHTRGRDLLAGGLLALMTLAFFWRTLSGDVYQPADGGDLVSFLYPTYRFAARTLRQGQLPLWNPHLYGGAPFIGDIQAGFLYPPNLLLFLLKPDFPYAWMQWLAIGHLWWAGLGVYVLVRTLGHSRPAALFAGLAFGLSDPLLIHLGNLNLIAVLSWMGWVLAAYHRALAERSRRWAGIAGLLFAVGNYAGHAQSSYYIGLAVVIYTTLWTLGRPTTDDQRRTTVHRRLSTVLFRVVPLITTGAITALLSAPILLPALELLPYTARADLAYQETVGFSLAPIPALVGLLTPGFFGRGPALHWSLWDRVELPYAGMVTLLLALAALMLAGDERNWRRLLPWLGLALFGFLVALGIYAPVHGLLTRILPGFASFRAPARAIVLWTLAVSVLSAYGMDAVMGKGKGQKAKGKGQKAKPSAEGIRFTDYGLRITNYELRTTHHSLLITHYSSLLKFGGLALLLLVTPLLYASLLVLQPDAIYFLRASLAALAVAWATLAWLGTWLLVGLHRRGRLRGEWFAGLLVALLFVELAATGAYTDVSETNPARGFDHPQIVAFLRQEMGLGDRQPTTEDRAEVRSSVLRRPSSLFRMDARTGIDDLWQPDTAALVGLQDVWGVANPLVLQPWERLWESTGGRGTRLYDLLNVQYVLVRDGTSLPDQFELALDAPGPLAVYRNPDPLPRAWLVHEALSVSDADAALAVLQQPNFDPARTVVLTTDDRRPTTNDQRPTTTDASAHRRITRSPDHPITRSPNHPITRSPDHPITQSPDHPITQSPNHPITHHPLLRQRNPASDPKRHLRLSRPQRSLVSGLAGDGQRCGDAGPARGLRAAGRGRPPGGIDRAALVSPGELALGAGAVGCGARPAGGGVVEEGMTGDAGYAEAVCCMVY